MVQREYTETGVEVVLGRKYRDTITGFTGIAVQRVEHLNGCIQIALDAGIKKDGDMGQKYLIDEERLEEFETGKQLASAATRGGAEEELPRDDSDSL